MLCMTRYNDYTIILIIKHFYTFGFGNLYLAGSSKWFSSAGKISIIIKILTIHPIVPILHFYMYL